MRTAPLALDLWTAQPPAVDARLGEWLAEPGLLSARIRAAAGELRLKVIRQELGTPGAEQRELLRTAADTVYSREVQLCALGRPWVYARTLIPDATLRSCPWLAELGDSPLDEMLQALSGVTRTPFEYAELSPAHELAARAQHDVADAARLTVPARRCLVAIRGRGMLVQEVFLPGVSAHAVA